MNSNTSEINKILLINPPESSQGGSTSAPLGLMYIAGLLRKNSIPVNIIDACLDGWDSIKKGLVKNNPTIVGIACPSYARAKSLKVAEIVKDYNKNIKVIFGGHHPTLMGKQILENYPFVDMVCIGEGEYFMLELCQEVELEKILGLGFRRNNDIIINDRRPEITDLDELPVPAWDIINPRRYGTCDTFVFDGVDFSKEVGARISFSRGCIGRCNFCSNHCMWAKWKHRSPKNVADELEFLNKTYNIRCFAFNDDCFSVNKKAAIDLCKEILDRKLKIYFSIVTRTDCIDEEILGALKKAGCYTICFGIETASPKLLKIMHKPIKIEQSQKAIQLVNSFGIRSVAFVIAGVAGENWETINETIDFLNRANPTKLGIGNGLMIFPGTEIYEMAKRQKLIDDSFWLTDYSYMIYTGENSRLKLAMFSSAIDNRKKLSRFFIINALRYHRFVTREIARGLKKFLEWIGLLKEKNKSNKPKAFCGKYTGQGKTRPLSSHFRVKMDIIMPVASGIEITKNCIESIIVNTAIPFRLIVVNNKSDLATKNYLKSLKNILKNNFTLIENIENAGWIKAVNQGLKVSNAPYVCIMNNDVIVSAGWLDNMVEVMDKNPKIGLMNPRWEKGKFEGLKGDYIETDWCRGFCVLIKREVIDKIGYFDEAYGFGYWEDHDYSVRANKAGYICGLALNSFVEHIKNVSVKSAMKQKEWKELFARNRDIFEKKWGRPKRIIIAVNRKISRDRTVLENIMAKALELAREQNRIYILSNVYNLSLPPHTNICYIKCLPVLFGLDIKIRILFNRKRKSNKRYNELYIGMDRSVLC